MNENTHRSNQKSKKNCIDHSLRFTFFYYFNNLLNLYVIAA